MEEIVTVAGAFLFLFMGMALPLTIMISGVYLMVKRRQWIHIERMKMIECGLVREDADFENAAGSFTQYNHTMFFDLLFYALLLVLGFLFSLFSALAIFLYKVLHLPVTDNLSIVAALGGVLGTFVLTLLIRWVPSLYRQRKLLLISCIMLTLMWGGFFIRQTGKVSPEKVKILLQNNLKSSEE